MRPPLMEERGSRRMHFDIKRFLYHNFVNSEAILPKYASNNSPLHGGEYMATLKMWFTTFYERVI